MEDNRIGPTADQIALLRGLTHKVPLKSIDSHQVIVEYEKAKRLLVFPDEFAWCGGGVEALVAEISDDFDRNCTPLVMPFFWDNHLWPAYSLTMWHRSRSNKESIVRRAFIGKGFHYLETLQSKPTRIVLLCDGIPVAAYEFAFHLAAAKGVQNITATKNTSSIRDWDAARTWIGIALEQPKSHRDRLAHGWVTRLEQEAAHLISFIDHCAATTDFGEQLRILGESGLFPNGGPAPNSNDLLSTLFFHFTNRLWLEHEDPWPLIQTTGEAISTDEPISEIVRSAMQLTWFSSIATKCGSALPFITKHGEVSHLEIDAKALGKDTQRYWENLPFEFHFRCEDLIGPSDCPADFVTLASEAPLFEGDIGEGEQFFETVLNEAASLKQWTIPPGAYIQLEIGRIKAVKLWEAGNEIACVFVDDRGYYISAFLNYLDHNFAIIGSDQIMQGFIERVIYEHQPDANNPDNNQIHEDAHELADRFRLGLKILIGSIVRDFWVVEEREKVFGAGLRTRKMNRLKSDSGKPRIVYLPRIRYVSNLHSSVADHDGLDYRVRKPHFVTGHLRKALKASESQKLLAQGYGIRVPEGFTWVRPHRRGDITAERVFRSRSALKCLRAIKCGATGNRNDDWYAFELGTKKWLEENGYEVQHVSANLNGDGGVDLQASKKSEHLLVQCKHWGGKIPPGTVREMIGTLETCPEGAKGVIVTSSELTTGARKLAREHGIQYVEQAEFVNYKTLPDL